MAEATRGVFEAIYDVLDWTGVLIQHGIIMASVVGLRATATGIPVGGGFSATLLASVVARIGQSVIRRADVRFDATMVLTAAQSGLPTVLTMPVAVGLLLIPVSLAKLAAET